MRTRLLLPSLCVISLALLCGAAARADDNPGVQPVGSPLAITAEPSGADHPAVASDQAGNFVAAWMAHQGDGSIAIAVRRFDSGGHPLGAETVAVAPVPYITYIDQVRIAVASDGTMVVTWSDEFGGVQARRLDANGQPMGTVIAVNGDDPCCAGQADVAFLRNGDFVVTWYDSSFPPFRPGRKALFFLDAPILARVFTAAGTPLADPFEVSTAFSFRNHPRVAADPTGGFAVVWEENNSAGGPPIRVRRFTDDGTPRGPESAVTNQPGFGPVALFTPAGELSVAWAHSGGDSFFDPSGLFAQRFAEDGSHLGAPILLDADSPLDAPIDAADSRDGHRVLVWGGATVDVPYAIYFRVFDTAWQPLQPALRVAQITPRSVNNFPGVRVFPPWPVIAAGGAGFLTAWDGMVPSPNEIPQVTGQLLAGTCFGGTTDLCLQTGRFRVDVAWHDPRSGASGTATAIPLTGDTGAFWFFSAGNAELLVKVLDGRPVNGHWWVFFGALTDLEYDLTVTDNHTGAQKVYHNPPYTLASQADINAFTDSAPPPPAPTQPTAAPAVLRAAGPCPAGACLGEFQVSVDFVDPATGETHAATGVPLSDDSAYFWFFDASNIELVVKVLDGRPVNGHHWVFYGALSDVDYTIRVDWPAQHLSRSYHNPHGHLESHADTQAFP